MKTDGTGFSGIPSGVQGVSANQGKRPKASNSSERTSNSGITKKAGRTSPISGGGSSRRS